MIKSLGRFEIDAAELWRAHPPVLHDAQKRVVLELAGGHARAPRGTIAVSRWAPSAEAPTIGAGSMRTIGVDGPFSYPEAEPGVDLWHVNFADPMLFAFYGVPAFAQDEIQVAEHPVLASVRERMLARRDEGMPALTIERGQPTPVLVRGAERWCAIDTDPELARPYGIYGRRLRSASLEVLTQAVTRLEDAPPTNIIAMAAPQGRGRYAEEEIRQILVTAITAFRAARAESPEGKRLRIHTGHWGTGAFGGDRVLMAAAQIVAARVAGVDELLYHSLDDGAARDFDEGMRLAARFEAGAQADRVVGDLHARGFVWRSSDGN